MSAGPEVWAGVLAAGAGRRLGGIPKALLRWRGLTFLETIASVARRGGASGVAVVLGHHAAIVGELASQVSDRLAYNPAPDRGMGSSARELSRVVPEGVALLLWPVDTPAITEETVRRLIEAARAEPGRVVIPVWAGRRGHPPVIPPAVVLALRQLDDETRLDHFLEAQGGPPLLLEVPDEGVLQDVDLVGDLRRLTAEGGDQ